MWISRDPIGEEGGQNVYGFTENSPVDAVDLLGELSSAACVGSYPGFQGNDFYLTYRFIGSKKEKVIQTVAATITFTGASKSCTVTVMYPERFRLGKNKKYEYDWHGMASQKILDTYCSCICEDCNEGGQFRATMNFRLYHGKNISTAGDPPSMDWLTSVTTATGATITPKYTYRDCDGKTHDISGNLQSDWYERPAAGTGTIGAGSKVAKVDHAYSGTITSDCKTKFRKPPPPDLEDYVF